jgi:hypothetical protein
MARSLPMPRLATRIRSVSSIATLEKQRVIATWSAQKIGAGQDWRKVTDEHLQAARVVVLLLTADFIASDVLDVAEKAARAGADLIPIRVRAYDYVKAYPGDWAGGMSVQATPASVVCPAGRVLSGSTLTAPLHALGFASGKYVWVSQLEALE